MRFDIISASAGSIAMFGQGVCFLPFVLLPEKACQTVAFYHRSNDLTDRAFIIIAHLDPLVSLYYYYRQKSKKVAQKM